MKITLNFDWGNESFDWEFQNLNTGNSSSGSSNFWNSASELGSIAITAYQWVNEGGTDPLKSGELWIDDVQGY